jgi:hypothetical protein
MPFDNSGLIPLLANSGFTIWLYRTPDTRAAALAPNYFTPADSRLAFGDVILLQASDALTLTTVRPGPTVPGGVVVDTAAAPFRVNRSAAQRFSVRQMATAVAMTVLLAPLAGGIVAGGQVLAEARVTGPVAQVSAAEADAYFASRGRDSQLGAWASLQSETLDRRETFEDRFEEMRAKFEGQDVPRPPHWGGYRVTPKRIEFWEDREHRLHHRRLFLSNAGNWSESLLYP